MNIITTNNRWFINSYTNFCFMKDSKVLLIYSGGTIGMKENPQNKSLEPFDFAILQNT